MIHRRPLLLDDYGKHPLLVCVPKPLPDESKFSLCSFRVTSLKTTYISPWRTDAFFRLYFSNVYRHSLRLVMLIRLQISATHG